MPGFGKDGFWQALGELDEVARLHGLLFYPSQWFSNEVLPKLEGSKTGGSLIPLSFCDWYGGV